jgi:hypothetical protein
MSVRIVAIGTFLALFAGNVLAAERVGSTIEAQAPSAARAPSANGLSPGPIRSIGTNVCALISPDLANSSSAMALNWSSVAMPLW